MSAAGALTLEALELRAYGRDVAVEQSSESTLFAQVGCVRDQLVPDSW